MENHSNRQLPKGVVHRHPLQIAPASNPINLRSVTGTLAIPENLGGNRTSRLFRNPSQPGRPLQWLFAELNGFASRLNGLFDFRFGVSLRDK